MCVCVLPTIASRKGCLRLGRPLVLVGQECSAKQTIKYASQVNADLIVILTDDGELNVSEIVLGAEEEKIINNDAQIATMCVNPVTDLYTIGNVLFM